MSERTAENDDTEAWTDLGADYSAAISPQYATASEVADLAGLCNRWVAALDREDQRLDRRIDWTQKAVFRMTVAACVLVVLVVGLIAALICMEVTR